MEKINVMRMCKKDVNSILVGDKILVPLNGFGTFTATAHKITDEGVLFIFDNYVVQHQMNEKDINECDFEKSDLKKWLDAVLFEAFPDWLKGRIVKLSIPTAGELFGHEDEWCNEYIEPDAEEQLPLMKERRNRVAYFNDNMYWGWLRNTVKKEMFDDAFAVVSHYGYAAYSGALSFLGVRPEFLLIR